MITTRLLFAAISCFVLSSMQQQVSAALPCSVAELAKAGFNVCAEPEEVGCLAALQLSGFDPTDIDSYNNWWKEDSSVVVAETGTYAGMDSVKEYMSYGTDPNGVYFSVTSENRIPFVLSADADGTGGGSCDLAIISNFTYNYDEPAGRMYTLGGKISSTVMGIYKFDYSNLVITNPNPLQGSANIQIDLLRGFYPPTFWDVAASLYETEAFRKLLCKTMRRTCNEVFCKNGYNPRTCMRAVKALPRTDAPSDQAPYNWRGASIGCRQLHLAFVIAGNSFHCPHISGISLPDDQGAIKCQDSNEEQIFTAETLFSEDELELAYTVGRGILGFDDSLFTFQPGPW